MQFIAVALVLIASTSALASEPSTLQQVEALLAETQKAKPACEGFSKSVAEVAPLLKSKETLSNKAEALKLIALLPQYPGSPDSFKKALNLLYGEYRGKGEVSDTLAKAMSNGYDCNLLVIHDVFQSLIQGAEGFHFSRKERAELSQLLFDRIIRDLDSNTTIIEALIYGSLLTSLIDEKVIEVSDAMFIETLRWNEEATLAKSQLHETNRHSTWTIGMELQLTEPLRYDLYRMARRLSRHERGGN